MKTILLPALFALLAILSVPAQPVVPPHMLPKTDDPTTPRTHLEAFEASTGRVVIKGTEEIGFVTGKNGTIVVKCVELREPSSNQRLFGLILIVRQNDGLEDASTVDGDEVDSLLKGVDYVSRADPTISALSHFEAGYATRGGFRVATYSSRRTSTTEAVAVNNRYNRARSLLDLTQLAQLKVILEQAQAKLEVIRKTK